MKKILLLLLLTLSIPLSAQSVIGAWEAITTKDGQQVKNVVTFSEFHQVSTWYHLNDGKFLETNGGAYQLNGNTMTETVEFDSGQSDRVGTTVSFQVEVSAAELKIDGKDLVWTRIDDGKPGALQGAWLMSGRKRDGEIQTRDTSGPRKTMKILSGTRFQWIAYNTETKEFLGTGGGTYTTLNGKYTENIEFFSRDQSRVGAKLEFDYQLTNGDWHHSGFSSKGDPLYEVWTKRAK
ncbi:membrane or secreted protein [Namhaeicola litoreus]|uniref:Membrane or secreted protein n=1 Tax=Namhaeicola litoreus TaxID=1052145 RepID=A0ABW3Y1T9_9FLAO